MGTPVVNSRPRPAPTPPAQVTAAFGIYLLTALISLVGVVLALNSDIWEQAVRESGARAAGSRRHVGRQRGQRRQGHRRSPSASIFLALYLFFAFKMRAGRNWARITLTVLSALSIFVGHQHRLGDGRDRTYSSATVDHHRLDRRRSSRSPPSC